MRMVNLSRVSHDDRSAAKDIAERARVDLKDCYQCGKCSAGCPMADAMDMRPQEVVRNLQLGILEAVFEAQGPWLCAGCEVCATRCPQDIEIATLIREVRRASKEAGHVPVPDSDTFEELFIRNVYQHGRSNEQYLAARYNLATRHLFQDVANAPRMMLRGMVGIKTHEVRDKDAVRRLIDRCLKKEGEEGGC